MPQTSSAPRLLLNRLRQMMAGDGSTRERLDRIVQLIAGNLVADVCSIYLRTPEDELELVATEGLRAEAVSSTRMKFDEGLVGQIAQTAEPLAIQDAPRHPAFSYRPETGEDPYHAFLGVPVLRGGRVIGVLTVQNRTERLYGDEEVEALETVAMVLAEVVAAEASRAETNGPSLIPFAAHPSGSATLTGRVLCDGLGMGAARLHDPVVPPAKFFADDPEEEARRLDDALARLREAVDSMMTGDAATLGEDPRDVMETYRLLADDPGWREKLHEGVRNGLSAEASVDRARREHRARLDSAKDQYLRERLHDLEDLDNRLLRVLGGLGGKGDGGNGEPTQTQPGGVLIARRLGPAEILEYRGAGLDAILLEEAAASSHAAIVARALGIPTIGGLDGLTTGVDTGDAVIVDAETGVAHIRPDQSLVDSYKARLALRSERQAEYEALRDLPCETLDGVEVKLMLNAGLRLDLDYLDTTGAAGVGLFRTEFQFLVSETLPRLDEQIALYERVIESAGGREILFRTVDLGGDKMLPNLNRQREENPALGWRSIRFALDSRGLFRRQLRALIRAARGGPLSVMFPMVTTPTEFFAARDLFEEELDWSQARGHPAPSPLRVGVMLETPALAYSLEEIAPRADFLSIGTNDLMQFFFAADRTSPQVSQRYDLVSRPAVRFLRYVSETCRELGLPSSVCGEATGQPLEALCLLALGYRRLSMPAGGIGPVKKMIRSVDLQAFKSAFFQRFETSNGQFRNEVLALARDFDVQLNES